MCNITDFFSAHVVNIYTHKCCKVLIQPLTPFGGCVLLLNPPVSQVLLVSLILINGMDNIGEMPVSVRQFNTIGPQTAASRDHTL